MGGAQCFLDDDGSPAVREDKPQIAVAFRQRRQHRILFRRDTHVVDVRDSARGIPACMACHDPSGAGNPGPACPAVHGQDGAYVARRLQEYRAGTTTAKDAAHFNLMASVAKPLTDEEIQSLGSYVQGLHARAAGTSKPASGH